MNGLSLVIITRNRADTLRRSLTDHVKVSPPPIPWELIVVDNGSSDSTPAVIDSFAGSLPIRGVVETQPGTSPARNRGIAEARYDFLAFTDDDITPEPDWLNAYARAESAYPEADYFGGTIHLDLNACTPPAWWLTDSGTLIPWIAAGLAEYTPAHVARIGLTAANGQPWVFYGGNMAFRRRFFDQHGLFDPRLGHTPTRRFATEEPFLQKRAMRAGAIPRYVPDSIVAHRIRPDEVTIPSRRRNARARGRASAVMAYLSRDDVRINRWRWGRLLKNTARSLPTVLGGRDPLSRLQSQLSLLSDWYYEYQMMRMIFSPPGSV